MALDVQQRGCLWGKSTNFLSGVSFFFFFYGLLEKFRLSKLLPLRRSVFSFPSPIRKGSLQSPRAFFVSLGSTFVVFVLPDNHTGKESVLPEEEFAKGDEKFLHNPKKPTGFLCFD